MHNIIEVHPPPIKMYNMNNNIFIENTNSLKLQWKYAWILKAGVVPIGRDQKLKVNL